MPGIVVQTQRIMLDDVGSLASGERIAFDVEKKGHILKMGYDLEEGEIKPEKVPTGHVFLDDKEYDTVEEHIRSLRKGYDTHHVPIQNISLQRDEGTPMHLGGIEKRMMTFAKGDSYSKKEELKALGMSWNPALKLWESPVEIMKKVAGVTFETILTYKKKSSWTYFD
jgi:hypothetical protein